jgi:5'-3' exonuclease
MNHPIELSMINPTFIFIDGSYYCFHRYYALMQWWKNAFPEEPLEDPNQNSIFVDKFNKTFVENLQQIQKKLKIPKTIEPILIVGKDCKRENIWRNEIFSNYKSNRVYDETFMGSPFFKMAYENKLFELGGVKIILKHPKLEADDCIAISVKYLINKYPTCKIYIITSDRDYLQLNAPNVQLFNLSFKNIAETKNCTGNAKKDLEIKIIMGDISDNIPSIFPKCGPKTALKCVEDEAFFKKKISENPSYYIQYNLNQKLINFNNIPKELVDEFMLTMENKFY